MPRKAILSLLTMTILPLGIIAWLSVSRLANSQTLLRQQNLVLWDQQLVISIQKIARVLKQIEQDLENQLASSEKSHTNRRMVSWRAPLIRQAFFMDAAGRLLYPDSTREMTEEEQRFIQRTRLLWHNQAILQPEQQQEHTSHMNQQRVRDNAFIRSNTPASHSLIALSRFQEKGWIPWYWEDGLHVLFWLKTPSGIWGAEVERAALISRMVAALPDDTRIQDGFTFCDAGGRIIYQWGPPPKPHHSPSLMRALPIPLESWTLQVYGTAENSLVQTSFVWQGSVLALLIATVIIAAIFFYRSSSQSLKEAEHRVQFVNQVSHELKTPLTNIRLYAELMDDEILEEEETARKQLSIIQSETQRLSRLIHNILTFSNLKKSRLTLHKGAYSLDTIIQTTIEAFLPSLKKLDFSIETNLNAPVPILIDPDASGQILANLISNVEKYAKDGKYLKITSNQSKSLTTVCIYDKGQGIAPEARKHIFKQYFRAKDSVTEGVTGTGIGLSISRELARLHGGDLQLETSENGACFCWSIPILRS